MPRTAQISKTNEYQLKMERTRRQWPSRRLRTPSSMPRAAPTRRTSAPRPSMTSPLGAPRSARCATLVSSVPIALERAARSHPGLHSRTRKDRPHATVKERVREATALGRNRYRGRSAPALFCEHLSGARLDPIRSRMKRFRGGWYR